MTDFGAAVEACRTTERGVDYSWSSSQARIALHELLNPFLLDKRWQDYFVSDHSGLRDTTPAHTAHILHPDWSLSETQRAQGRKPARKLCGHIFTRGESVHCCRSVSAISVTLKCQLILWKDTAAMTRLATSAQTATIQSSTKGMMSASRFTRAARCPAHAATSKVGSIRSLAGHIHRALPTAVHSGLTTTLKSHLPNRLV